MHKATWPRLDHVILHRTRLPRGSVQAHSSRVSRLQPRRQSTPRTSTATTPLEETRALMATRGKANTTRTTRPKTTQAAPKPTRSSATTRLPLANRSNSPERVPSRAAQPKPASHKLLDVTSTLDDDSEREPIKVRLCFLCWRPHETHRS